MHPGPAREEGGGVGGHGGGGGIEDAGAAELGGKAGLLHGSRTVVGGGGVGVCEQLKGGRRAVVEAVGHAGGWAGIRREGGGGDGGVCGALAAEPVVRDAARAECDQGMLDLGRVGNVANVPQCIDAFERRKERVGLERQLATDPIVVADVEPGRFKAWHAAARR